MHLSDFLESVKAASWMSACAQEANGLELLDVHQLLVIKTCDALLTDIWDLKLGPTGNYGWRRGVSNPTLFSPSHPPSPQEEEPNLSNQNLTANIAFLNDQLAGRLAAGFLSR
jgi:hypothetical protein